MHVGVCLPAYAHKTKSLFVEPADSTIAKNCRKHAVFSESIHFNASFLQVF